MRFHGWNHSKLMRYVDTESSCVARELCLKSAMALSPEQQIRVGQDTLSSARIQEPFDFITLLRITQPGDPHSLLSRRVLSGIAPRDLGSGAV